MLKPSGPKYLNYSVVNSLQMFYFSYYECLIGFTCWFCLTWDVLTCTCHSVNYWNGPLVKYCIYSAVCVIVLTILAWFFLLAFLLTFFLTSWFPLLKKKKKSNLWPPFLVGPAIANPAIVTEPCLWLKNRIKLQFQSTSSGISIYLNIEVISYASHLL